MSYKIEVYDDAGAVIASDYVEGDDTSARHRASELAKKMCTETAAVFDADSGVPAHRLSFNWR